MEKWNALRQTITQLQANEGEQNSKHTKIFDLILRLFAHEDVVGGLYDAYDTNADDLLFHIPQLCTFLLHGNYAKQTQLECFMLDKCSSSVHWAHLLYWFINSFCMEKQSRYFSGTASSAPSSMGGGGAPDPRQRFE